MGDYYRVVEVNPELAIGQEPMGTKRKFWYRPPWPDERLWLFKRPREHTGEHWAEKIAAEVSGLLRVNHADVELAQVVEGPNEALTGRGSVSPAFLSDRRQLIHGNEIMARIMSGYDRDLRQRQRNHTFGNIVNGLRLLLGETETPWMRTVTRRFCELLVLDAVIGNTDRHHENWAVRVMPMYEGVNIDIAPSFDHASSLGRELSDDRRSRLIAESGVGKYSEQGRGGVYWSESNQYGPSPLQLVRTASQEHPDLFLPALRKAELLDLEAVAHVVRRIPPGWMSEVSREFAIALMEYNCQELKKLLVEVSP